MKLQQFQKMYDARNELERIIACNSFEGKTTFFRNLVIMKRNEADKAISTMLRKNDRYQLQTEKL